MYRTNKKRKLKIASIDNNKSYYQDKYFYYSLGRFLFSSASDKIIQQKLGYFKISSWQ